jgi:hypothetical protein
MEEQRKIVGRMLSSTKEWTFLFHDVSGEVLTHRDERAADAPFLRRADALIFLVDPLGLDPVQDWRDQAGFDDRDELPDDTHQADLLRACLAEIGEERLREVPVAVAISKSDIVTAVQGREYVFSKPWTRQAGNWISDWQTVNDEVRHVLAELGAADLVATAQRHVPSQNLSFHAVAAIGAEP